jgi:hypothetical protein
MARDETMDTSEISTNEAILRRKSSQGELLNKSSDTKDSGEQNYKTELCRTWVEKNFCPYKEKCRFAHGKKDIHEKSINSKNYKQKECNSFHKKGFCPYGPRCHFKHEERKLDEITRPFYPFLLKSQNTIEKFIINTGDKKINPHIQIQQNIPHQLLNKELESPQATLPIFEKVRGHPCPYEKLYYGF